MENENVWSRLREVLSNVDLKTYLYAIGAIAVIIAILINVTGPSKYGSVKKDGKFYLNIEQIASDYGLDLSESANESVDYVNNTDHNLTQDLANSLILTGIFLDQNGMTDKNAKGEILANIVKEYQKQAKGKIYTNNDLNVIRNTDKTALQDYYNNIDSTVQKYFNNMKNINEISTSNYYTENESNINEEKVVNMRGAISANLLKMVDINISFINELVSIPATNEGAVYQLQLINLISEQNAFLKSLAYIDTDPAKYVMLDGDNFNMKFSSDMTSILNTFGDYFRKNNAITD